MNIVGQWIGFKMSVVLDIIKEEHDRLVMLKQDYFQKIQQLPKGAITKKKRNNHLYLYLTYRDQKKVVSKYIGKYESDKSNIVLKQIEERQNLKEKYQKVNNSLKEVQRVLNGKKI